MSTGCASSSDSDGLTDDAEINVYGTDPLQPDTDGGGLNDGDEINTYGTDPLQPDTDGDGLNDGDEINVYGTDPRQPDTDRDGLNDGEEIDNGLDPLDPADWPPGSSVLKLIPLIIQDRDEE